MSASVAGREIPTSPAVWSADVPLTPCFGTDLAAGTANGRQLSDCPCPQLSLQLSLLLKVTPSSQGQPTPNDRST